MALALFSRNICFKKISTTISRNYGYIVLVPEIGEDLSEKNPLLQKNGLPEFNNLTIENCMAAIGKQTLQFEVEIKDIEKQAEKNVEDVFTAVLDPLEVHGAPLHTTWGISKTLYLGNSTLMPTKSYVAIHDRAKRSRAMKFNSLPIYNVIKKKLNEKADFSMEQKRVLKKFAIEGKLNGLDLDNMKKAQLETILKKLVTEKTQFKSKIDTTTKRFAQRITRPEKMKEFPVDVLKLMSQSGNHLEGPWNVSLQPHIYYNFLEYCPDRELRWNVWNASVSRGSGYGNKDYETSTHIENIRAIRNDQAKLLGYKNFVDMSMETKMAQNVGNIKNMFKTLVEYAKPAHENELKNLLNFACDNNFKGSRIELWDVAFWNRKRILHQYGIKQFDFSEYFPLDTVLKGLFEICQRLFGISIRLQKKASTWHKDVRYYDVFEENGDTPLAGFYLDAYARTNEKLTIFNNNGWMIGIQNRSIVADTQTLGALIFNFKPPTKNTPSLLSFQDVNALFHKFGNCLQHVLSKSSYSEVAGLSNLEWDVVEVCGHVLCHWLYNKSTLDAISGHYKDGRKLEENKLQAILNRKLHLAGTDLCQELYLSHLDLDLHSTRNFWLDVVKTVWPEYRCFPLLKNDSHPCSFTQIFTEEWAAAYYSRVWSRVVAADAYGAFHEARGDEQLIAEIGKRFKDTFLSLGGSCDPSQVFRKFRGRDPSPKALLRSLDLKGQKSN